MYEFLTQHQSLLALIAYWIFSAAVSSMPDPTSSDKPGYLWLFRFCHTTAGNISTVVGSRISGLKILVPLLMVPLLFSTTACAAVHYTVHPGAVNKTDSVAYDTLLVAENVIDQARVDLQNGQLPARTKEALNSLILSYNVAREAWLTYRGTVSPKVFADLSDAITQFKEAK